MNYHRSTNAYVEVYEIKEELSDNNIWKNREILWKKVWVSIKPTNLKSQLQYRFIAKWLPNFPDKFVVKLFDTTFKPIKQTIIDKNHDIIMFFAIKKEGRSI